MIRSTTTSLLFLSSLFVACGAEDGGSVEAPEPQAPVLPPQELRDVVPELQARVDAAPPAPAEPRMAALRDLIETAFIDGHADRRTQALAANVLDEEEGIDWALEAALTHENVEVRFQCATRLGERGRRAAIPLLAVRLRPIGYEKDVRVRCAANLALVRLGVLGCITELNGWMNDAESAQVAGQTAMDVLRACGREPGEAPTYVELQRGITEVADHWRRTGAPPSGAELPTAPAAEDALLEARLAGLLLVLEGEQLRPVDETRFVMGSIGRLGTPLLRVGLHAEQPYLRTHTLEIVHNLGPAAHGLAADVLPLLGNELDSSVAAMALGAIGAREAFDPLMAMLGSEQIERRASAAAALGKLGDLRALDALLALMRDPSEITDVRVQAAFAVALLDPGVRYLEKTLEEDGYHLPTLRELLDAVRAERR